MVGALWTGISGLSGSQTGLDNESNNIANVNTIGYKASRVSFADQMYQDKIGKGVSSFDVEKMYTQGNLKNTGVSYDMALSGDGFFQVKNGNETYYTRAGNFRMGESGTLEDVGQNKVQGWAMQDLTDDDIDTTNPDITYFTDSYTKLLGNKIIEDTSTIETIIAKATDYNDSVEGDSTLIFSGAGQKTESSKVSDVEALISEYNEALSLYAEADPKPTASTSNEAKVVLDFPLTGSELQEGDEVEVTINGEAYSVSYSDDQATTMKNLADKISNITGLKAYMTDDTTSPYNVDTQTNPELGYIVVEGLIPGDTLDVSSLGWKNSQTEVFTKGNVVTVQSAVTGTGMGHITSVKEALSEAISGKQMDVYTEDEIAFNKTAQANNKYTYQIDIYDPELDTIVTVPSSALVLDGSIKPTSEVTFVGLAAGSGDTAEVDGVVFTVGASDVTAAQIASFFSGEATPTPAQGSFSGTSGGLYEAAASADGATLIYTSTATDTTTYSTVADISVTGPTQVTTAGINGLGYLASTDDEKETSLNAMIATINADPDLSKYVEAYNFNGNMVVKTLDDNFEVDFSGKLYTAESVEEQQTITVSGTGNAGDIVSFLGTNVTLTTETVAGTASEADIATDIESAKTDIITKWNAENSGSEIKDITAAAGVITIIYEPTEGNVPTINASTSGAISFGESLETQPGRATGVIARNADFSNREGAGAEFLEIKTTINQTASKNDLQLRLDKLGLTDSAFGDFSVDDSGLITMTQDGVMFAIGQVAVARFTDNRGLEAAGDNLLTETLRSGTAIFNADNDKMAEITGGSLELSTADLSESLVNLMVFQRAFEANAKSITTADGILTTLIQLKNR